MSTTLQLRSTRCLGIAAAFAWMISGPAVLADDAAKPDVLRVCQDPSNLPFSNDKGEGFENKIAELFARSLGVKLEYYSFPQRMGFIRNTLMFKLPSDSNYRCDLVMQQPEKSGQIDVTRPYYRSTYVLVYPKGGKADGAKTEQEFLKLDRAKLASMKIGVYDRTPGGDWLVRNKLLDQAVPYQTMNARPDFYPGEIIDHDLLEGKLDAVIVWGPIAGYAAKKAGADRLVVIPLESSEGIVFDYAMSMGVRRGEPQWKATVQGLLDSNRDAILAILRDYNVPLVNDTGKARQ